MKSSGPGYFLGSFKYKFSCFLYDVTVLGFGNLYFLEGFCSIVEIEGRNGLGQVSAPLV